MVTLDLLNQMEGLRSEMDQMFRSILPTAEFPAVNVTGSDSELRVQAELPGIAMDAIELTLKGRILTLRGSRPEHALQEGEHWIRRERETGAFERTIELPGEVDADRVEAQFSKGILTIRLPRAAAELPRRIDVRRA